MRILSKFQDYYDSALAFGRDESLVFKRFQESIEVNRYEKAPPFGVEPRMWNPVDWYGDYQVPSKELGGYNPHASALLRNFVIAFCGKLYRGMQYLIWDGDYKPAGSFYSRESFHKFLISRGVKLTKKKESNSTSKYQDKRKPAIEEYLERQGTTEYLENFIQERLVIALWLEKEPRGYRSTIEYVKNPCLKDFDFIKVMDPYAAFQELSMYIGGILAPESNPMVEISDKDRVQQHGFDKWSFRKLPEKRSGS